MTVMIIFLGYLLAVIVMYKVEFNYWQNKYPLFAELRLKRGKKVALYLALIWPVHLLVNIFPNRKEYKKYSKKRKG